MPIVKWAFCFRQLQKVYSDIAEEEDCLLTYAEAST